MNNKQKIGSETAKGGFRNEHIVCDKFNDWKFDKDAQKWLQYMGYDLKSVSSLKSIHIPTKISQKNLYKYSISVNDYKNIQKYKKADIQVKLIIEINNVTCIENISLKKSNMKSNFNQIDKRKVSTYRTMWSFDNEIEKYLKLFTGEEKYSNKKRMYITDFPKKVQEKIVSFFNLNKTLILCDVLRGRGSLSADWILVTKKIDENQYEYKINEINKVINYFSQGDVEITRKGNLKIGRITMQRKGGTPDPTSLQFKFKPLDLFNI